MQTDVFFLPFLVQRFATSFIEVTLLNGDCTAHPHIEINSCFMRLFVVVMMRLFRTLLKT